MPEINLLDVNPDIRERYLERYCASMPAISDFTFSSLFMWADYYTLKISFFRELACIICTGGTFPPSMLMPLGDVSQPLLSEAVDHYHDWFNDKNLEMIISCVEEKHLPAIQSLKGYEFSVYYNRDYSDYIYKTSDFTGMNGSAYRSFRQKINSFRNHYPDSVYSRFTEDDIPECRELLNLWKEQKGYMADAEETSLLLDHYSRLELTGGAVRINGRINAFIIGEKYGSTGYIISGKADCSISGLYLYALREFVINEFSDMDCINRCEDLGISTLRDAKMSWQPSALLHKYNVKLKKK